MGGGREIARDLERSVSSHLHEYAWNRTIKKGLGKGKHHRGLRKNPRPRDYSFNGLLESLGSLNVAQALHRRVGSGRLDEKSSGSNEVERCSVFSSRRHTSIVIRRRSVGRSSKYRTFEEVQRSLMSKWFLWSTNSFS